MDIIIKTQAQIEGIRTAGHIARSALLMLKDHVKAGVHTLELNNIAQDYLATKNAVAATVNYKGYKFATCISPNDVICHGVPSDKVVLRDGDITNIDITAIHKGFFGDTCMMYSLGTVSPEAQKLLDVTKEALKLGIMECYPGNRLGNVGFVINQYIRQFGYSVVEQFCGHGIGLKFHEDPEVLHIAKRNSGPLLKAGMVFTIEPMINEGKFQAVVDKLDKWTARTVDGKLSAQEEHTIAITTTGFDVLTDVEGTYSDLKPNIQRPQKRRFF